jgi:hypothetical protein
MKHKFEKVICVDTPYRPDKGSFARTTRVVDDRHKVDHWYFCRDIFHNILFNLKMFFLSHESNKGSSIAAFMQRIEEKLDIQPRSEYGPTQRKTIMWIKPSKWWIKYGMRRSLFTCLLRAGSNYSISKDNLYSAIEGDKYLSKTPYAFKRFMDGNTKYTGRKRGWFKQFCDLSPTDQEIDKLLVKP